MNNLIKMKPEACVIGTSDVCSRDPTRDVIVESVVDKLKKFNLYHNVSHTFVGNDYDDIKKCIEKVLVEHNPILIITVGGTGLRPRDVTPDVSSSLYDKNCPGISTALHMVCLRYSSGAALMRLTAGIIGGCLLINLPASERSCKECLIYLEEFIHQAMEQVRDNIGMKFKLFQGLKQNNNNHNNNPAGDQRKNFGQPALEKKKLFIKPRVNVSVEKISTQVAKNHQQIRTAPSKSRNIMEEIFERHRQDSGAQSSSLATAVGDTSSRIDSKVPIKLSVIESSASTETAPTKTVARKALVDRSSSFPALHYEVALDRVLEYSTAMLDAKNCIDFDLTKRWTTYKILYSHILAEDIEIKAPAAKCKISNANGYLVSIPTNMLKYFRMIGRVQADLISDRKEFEKACSGPESDSTFYSHLVSEGDVIPSGDFIIVPTERAELQSKNKVILNELDQETNIGEVKSVLDNEQVIRKGTIVGPIELGLMLSLNLKSVKTWPKPNIGILAVGDTLKAAVGNESSGSVSEVDLAGPVLKAMLGTMYRYPITQMGIVPCEPDDIKTKLVKSKCDVFILTGDTGLNASIIEEYFDGRVIFGQVNVKPTRSIAFSVIKLDNKIIPVFSIPQDPAAACMAVLTLALPMLEQGVKRYLEPNLTGLKSIGKEIKVMVIKLIDDDDSYQFDATTMELLRAQIIGEPLEGLIYPVSVSLSAQRNELVNLIGFNCLIPTVKGKRLETGDKLIGYMLHNTF